MRLTLLSLTLFFILFSCSQNISNKIPKNIILFIGDGMGAAQITALTTTKDSTNLERFPVGGLLKTHSGNHYITDSAAGATALGCGEKTYNLAISVSMDTLPLKTALEYARELGKSTGLVVTSIITHATPAGFIAHVDNRHKYNEIARQIASNPANVLIGGGWENFIPQNQDSSKREDDLDLLKQLSGKMTVIKSDEEFRAHKNGKDMVYLYSQGQPGIRSERTLSLKEMTDKAIEILSQNKNGFFLMVEGSQIDWGGHANNFDYIVSEVQDFDDAVGSGLDFAIKNKETLVIVTADHETGGLALLDGSIKEKKVTKVSFATDYHTGVMVPIFTFGPQSTIFGGIHENTFVGKKMIEFNR
jgi:alkaline phosphatase